MRRLIHISYWCPKKYCDARYYCITQPQPQPQAQKQPRHFIKGNKTPKITDSMADIAPPSNKDATSHTRTPRTNRPGRQLQIWEWTNRVPPRHCFRLDYWSWPQDHFSRPFGISGLPVLALARLGLEGWCCWRYFWDLLLHLMHHYPTHRRRHYLLQIVDYSYVDPLN